MPVNTRVQIRRGSSSDWTSADPTLYAGEIAYETNTGKFKIGDGTTAWSSLDYAAVPPTGFLAGSGLSVNVAADGSTVTYSLSDPTIQAADITDFVDAVNDRVADLITAGSNIQLTYTDSGNDNSTLQIAVTGISFSGHTHTSSDITDFSEAVDDRVNGLLVAGSGVSLSYNDGSNTLTISSSLAAGSGIAVTENAGTYTISLSDPTIQVADITDLTASAAELNTLDGITASTAELNILDGVTADYTEINLLDGAIANTVVNSKAVIYGASGEISAASIATSGNVTVGGDLIVNGSTTTVNSTVTTLDDPILTLGGDTAPIGDDNKDRGVEFRYFSGSAKVGFFGYDDSTGKFTFIPDATNTSEVFSGTTGEIDAKIDWTNINNKPDPVVAVDLTGDVTGSGNLTMTDLGGGTISITTTVAANSVALGTDTTGNYVASIANGNYITGGGTGSEGAALTLAVDATSANTASKVVARDASGNFSAGIITADLSGTATNATNIEVDASSANTNHLVFVNGTDGNLKPSVNSNLRFDAANNELLGDDSTTPTTKLKYFVIDGGTP